MWNALAALALLSVLAGCAETAEDDIYTPNQTSATLMMKHARAIAAKAPPENRAAAEQRFVIVYVLYSQARGEALQDEVFFGVSIVAARAVQRWLAPALKLKDRLGDKE